MSLHSPPPLCDNLSFTAVNCLHCISVVRDHIARACAIKSHCSRYDTEYIYTKENSRQSPQDKGDMYQNHIEILTTLARIIVGIP